MTEKNVPPTEKPTENTNRLADTFILQQDFHTALGLTKAQGAVELRKPEKHEWFRVLPDVGWPAFLLKAGDSRDDEYIVTPAVAKLVPTLCKPTMLRVVANSAGHKFIWAMAVPDQLKPHKAHLSAQRCAEVAEKEWVRMAYGGSGYEWMTATAQMPEPDWPKDPNQMLELVLEMKGIQDQGHEIIQKLVRGG